MSAARKPRASVPRKPRRSAPPEAGAPGERQDLAAIVTLLRGREAFTRQELEAETGLGRAAVSDRLAALTALGLAEEGEAGPSSGGRAPRLVRFSKGAGLALVAVVGQNTLGIGVADLAGTLVFEHHETTATDLPADAILARLVALFDWALEQLSFAAEAVWSIALSLPGDADAPPGAAGPEGGLGAGSWRGTPLVSRLSERYRCDVHLRSRIQMMTLGELRFGMETPVADLVVVDVGKEIAAGVISGGRLHLGAQSAAGLLGHSPVAGATAPCRCGNLGCLETCAGSAALAAYGAEAARVGRSAALAAVMRDAGTLTAIDVLQCARDGDLFAAELLAQAGRLVGATAATLVNVLNPAVIVLTGRLAQGGDVLLAAFRQALYRTCHPLVTRDLIIMRSRLGSSGALVGAAIVATDAVFDPRILAGWVGGGTPARHPALAARLAELERSALCRAEPPDALETRAAG